MPRRVNPIPIVAGVVALAVLWLVRPVWHGLAMFFWTEPLVWLPPVVLLAAGAVLLRRSRRNWTTLEDLRSGVRPPAWLAAFPVLAFVLLLVLSSLQGPLVGRSIVNHTILDPRTQVEVSVWVPAETDLDRAIELIVDTDAGISATVAESAAEGVRLSATTWAATPAERGKTAAELRRRWLRLLREHGLSSVEAS